MATLQNLKQRADTLLWRTDLKQCPIWKALGVRIARMVIVVIRDLADGQLTLRAMSLVYTTLLSMVPLLAVSFSVLKAFGVHNQIEPVLLNLLAPLGERGIEVSNRIIEFVDNIKAGLLGSVGLAFLIYTVVSLLQKVERSFNFTWHVTHHRPFSQRFSDYLSVILIGPVLVFSAIGITASVMSTSVVQTLASIQPFGVIIEYASRLVPYVLIIAAFTFIYIFIPNTKVRIRSALVGALIAGVLWETTGWIFASFVVSSTKYTVIYSTFATLIVFMIWLYLSWLILLVGASIAFYHQHPEFISLRGENLRLSSRLKDKVALMLMTIIGQAFHRNQSPRSAEAMAQYLNLPTDIVEAVLGTFQSHNIITATDAVPVAFLPTRPLEHISVQEVLEAVRTADESVALNLQTLPIQPSVDRVFETLHQAQEHALNKCSVRDLVGDIHQVDQVTRTPGT